MRDSVYINISAGLTIFFLLSAFTVPKILRPLNIGWFYFGKFLHLVISPIIMSIIFFLIMTPLGLVMRILHKSDPLALNYHELPTYWIDREIQPNSGSFENQF